MMRSSRTLRRVQTAKPERVDPVALPFQPDPGIIQERRPPWPARSVIYIVAALLSCTAIWASLSRVDRIVIARGKLVTVDPLMVVQPFEAGIIRSINVHVGDTVHAGAVLVTLDPTFTTSQAVANRERLDSMVAEERRLEAEVYHHPFPQPDDRLDAKNEKLQAAIYVHRQAEYTASVKGAEEEMARLTAALKANREAQSGLAKRIAVSDQIEDIRTKLYERKLGSLLNLLQTRIDHLNLVDQLQEKQDQEVELQHQLAAAKEKRDSYINNWLREAGERLTAIQQEISTETQKLTSATRRAKLVSLRAPADGVVLEISKRSIGSVVKEAEPIVTLVPSDSRLEAEVDVEGSDVAHLQTGQHVRIKLDALSFQRHGTIPGVLRVISENSFEPDKAGGDAALKPDGQPAFFRARIALGTVSLRNVPKDFRLLPGMTATAEILIGKRTIISYVLDPVVRLFDESLREP